MNRDQRIERDTKANGVPRMATDRAVLAQVADALRCNDTVVIPTVHVEESPDVHVTLKKKAKRASATGS